MDSQVPPIDPTCDDVVGHAPIIETRCEVGRAHGKHRIAAIVWRVTGWVAIGIWGVLLLGVVVACVCLGAVGLWALDVPAGPGGGNGWVALAAGVGIAFVALIGVALSCTLLPLGLGCLFAARWLREGKRPAFIVMIICWLVFAGAVIFLACLWFAYGS